MTTKSKASQASHDRSALIQWVGLAVVAVLGLIAAFVLFEGNENGGHSGAPAQTSISA